MDEILKYKFLKDLQSLSFVETLYLYGSRARGEHAERSDIDLAVLCPGASEEGWDKVLQIIENADTLLKIDCVRLDTLKEDNPLKSNILNDGKILFTNGESNV
jgi:predicted nucleotidyltransferase